MAKHKSKYVPKFHGDPIVKIAASRPKRGLKQAEKLKHGPVLTVVNNGQVLLGKRFRRALKTAAVKTLSPQPSVSASATSQWLPGRGGVPAKIEPPTRNNQEYRDDSPPWDTTSPTRPEERIPGRDRGSH